MSHRNNDRFTLILLVRMRRQGDEKRREIASPRHSFIRNLPKVLLFPYLRYARVTYFWFRAARSAISPLPRVSASSWARSCGVRRLMSPPLFCASERIHAETWSLRVSIGGGYSGLGPKYLYACHPSTATASTISAMASCAVRLFFGWRLCMTSPHWGAREAHSLARVFSLGEAGSSPPAVTQTETPSHVHPRTPC